MLHPKLNTIYLFNLEQKTVSKIPHLFISSEIDQTTLHTFTDQSVICLEEKGKYGDDRYRLSYYNYEMVGMNGLQQVSRF